jgi:hypothetical protein
LRIKVYVDATRKLTLHRNTHNKQDRDEIGRTKEKQNKEISIDMRENPAPGTCVISAVSYRIISQDGRLKRIDAQQALPISLVTAAIGIISTAAAAAGHLICTKHDRIGGLRRRTGSVKKLLLLTVSTSRT